MDTITFYSILGISESATLAEIKTAYREKTKLLHPDKGGSKELFQLINAAWQTLSDPDKRAKYDYALKPHNTEQPSQPDNSDTEIPESPNLFVFILQFLLYLGIYALLYWGIMAVGKWLHLERLAHVVYFFVAYYLFSKSIRK
jgi:curved DNA-binding protein CbpA